MISCYYDVGKLRHHLTDSVSYVTICLTHNQDSAHDHRHVLPLPTISVTATCVNWTFVVTSQSTV